MNRVLVHFFLFNFVYVNVEFANLLSSRDLSGNRVITLFCNEKLQLTPEQPLDDPIFARVLFQNKVAFILASKISNQKVNCISEKHPKFFDYFKLDSEQQAIWGKMENSYEMPL